MTRKQKTYSILDDEIYEDNVVVGDKSITRNTDSNKKRFKKEITESQDDDDEVIRRSIDVFDITTMALGFIFSDLGILETGLFGSGCVGVRVSFSH